MVQPNLIHPVPVVIQRKDAAATVVDDDFREPVQQAARKSNVTIPGQVKWYSDQDLQMISKGGPDEVSDGYVLFRYRDLEAANSPIARGDRFIKIGRIDVDVYVTKVEPQAHWPDQGGATLVKAYFTDRQPGRQNRGKL
jgi:hypothetical protein